MVVVSEYTGKDVTVRPVEYQVTILPPDHPSAQTWGLTVAYRGAGRFAVLLSGAWALNRSGGWDLEDVPSERAEEWLADHRFDEAEALHLAVKHAPTVQTNGRTAAEVMDALKAAGEVQP